MEYKVNSGIWGTMFGVPCIVADNLLKIVSGDHLKVLLYLLRYSGTAVKTEEISANTGVSEQQAEESIIFWEQLNILIPENGLNQSQPVNNIMTAPAQPSKPVPKTPVNAEMTAKPAAPVPVQETANTPASPASKKTFHNPSKIAEIKTNNSDISALFQIVETIIVNVNHAMQNSLIWIYEYLGLKIEVIVTIVNYCVSIDKANANYIEEVARSWAKKEIDTLEKAQEEADRLIELRDYTSKFMNICSMNKITPNIKKMIDSCYEAGYNMEVVKYAYEITVENTGNFSFPYINKILGNWIEKGIRTIDDAKNDAAEHKKNYKPKPDNSDGFDADEYEIFLNNF